MIKRLVPTAVVVGMLAALAGPSAAFAVDTPPLAQPPVLTRPTDGTTFEVGEPYNVTWQDAFDGGNPIESYQVFLDGRSAGAVDAGNSTSGVDLECDIPGEHTIKVVAHAADGRTADSSASFTCEDTWTPSVPEILSPEQGFVTASHDVTLRWEQAQDLAGIAKYKVVEQFYESERTTVLATVGGTVTTYTVRNLAEGEHHLGVIAVDTSGLESDWAGSVDVNVDLHAPTIPQPEARFFQGPNGKGLPVALVVSAADLKVCSISATVNGKKATARDQAFVGVNTVLPASKALSVTVSATDCLGRSATKTFKVKATIAKESAAKFSKGWSTKKSKSYLNGAAKAATKKGAKVTWKFTGAQFAWVYTGGPKSGAATVYVDNKKVASVDTRWDRTTHRVVRDFEVKPGKHTVSIVVAGTRGRPGVWVDGFVSIPLRPYDFCKVGMPC